MMGSLERHPRLKAALCAANKAITYAIYVAFPCLIIWLAARGDAPAAARALAVPAVGFAALTALRARIDAPRPYEAFDTPSALPKSTQGKSFPSRHAFSVFVIGMTFLASAPSPIPGAVVLALGCALAALRVVLGVHFPKDVAVGAALGILVGVVGFWAIP